MESGLSPGNANSLCDKFFNDFSDCIRVKFSLFSRPGIVSTFIPIEELSMHELRLRRLLVAEVWFVLVELSEYLLLVNSIHL